MHAAGFPGTLLLDRNDIDTLLGLTEYISAVEDAFRAHAQGQSLGTALLDGHGVGGEFHVKAGGLNMGKRSYFAVKINGGFFANTQNWGLPNILGSIVLCDAENGYPLALLDSVGITRNRTGAATAVAAKYLARKDSHVATICGLGVQGRIQLMALHQVLPITRAYAWSIHEREVPVFVRDMSDALGIEILAAQDLGAAARQSDVIVTCTPSTKFFLARTHVRPGTFVAAVGADSRHKQELEPELVASATVVADILDQSATVGELHHALDAGLTSREGVHEIGQVIAGMRPGRSTTDEVTIYDSTGTALQDVAAAALCYEKARASGTPKYFNLAGAPA